MLKKYISVWSKGYDGIFNFRLICVVLRIIYYEGYGESGVYLVKKVKGGKEIKWLG